MQTAYRIRAIRQRLGLTQAEFGDRLGVRQDTVSLWERGEIPLTLADCDKIDSLTTTAA